MSGSTAEGWGVWGFGQKSVITNKFGKTFVSVTNSGNEAKFGSFVVPNPTRIKQLVVSMYDENGTPQWVLYSKDVQVEPISMAADNRGNLYLLLFNTGKGQIGNEWVNTGNQATLLLKISSEGTIVWLKPIKQATGRGLAIDSLDNIFVTGVLSSFTGVEVIGRDTLTVLGGQDIVVMKYSPGSVLIWAKRYGGEKADHTAQSGGLYQSCTSTSHGELIVVVRGQSPTGENYYMVKTDSSGRQLWQKDLPWVDDDIRGLATDSKGNIYLTGGAPNAIFHKYDHDGNFLFAKNIDAAEAIGDDIVIDMCDNVWVQGPVWGSSITIDASTASIGGGNDPMFIAGFDEIGNVLMASLIGSGGAAQGFVGISVDNNGHFFIAGQYIRELFLGGYYVSTGATAAMFIARYRYGLWCDLSVAEEIGAATRDVNVFPNPVANRLTVQARDRLPHLSIVDVLGRRLMEAYPAGKEYTFDLAEFPAGMYFVTCEGKRPVRVIKE
ncbi:MAG: T9SS type A sorting domain-containing protein [Taibaiella sp.]|nr:T9SS type A sorting domain-containing protein [Taibaiella sp.]